jgi:hypothetical protein
LSMTWWTRDGYEYLGHFELGVSVWVCRVRFVEMLVMISEGTWTYACAYACADASADKLRHQGTRPSRQRLNHGGRSSILSHP